MADEKIDVNKLIEDAKRQAEEAKAAADAAAKEAAKKSSKNQKENAVKQILLQRQKRISENQKNLDNFMFNIKRIAKLVATKKATAGDQKELQRISKLYNELLDVQNKLVTETQSISAGTVEVDLKTGEVKTEAKTPAPDTQYKYGVYKGVVDGKEVDVVQTSDLQIFVNQQPYTGSIKFGDKVSQYKNGYLVTDQKKTDKKEKLLPGKKEPAGVVGEPSVKPGEPIKTTAEMAAFRAGERGGIGPVAPITQKQDLKGLLAKTEFWYDLPDYIFETIPELGDLLVKAVDGGWDAEKFLSAAKLTKWWQSNAATFRTRIIDKAKYNELRSSGVDVSKTDYGQYLSKQMRNVKAQAKTIAGVTLDDAQAQAIAEKIYDGNLDDDPLAINRLIIPYIGKVTDRYAKTDVTTYGGQALQNYQMLQGIAKSNGLSLKDILPQISTTLTGGDLEKAVLQGIAAGDIDINRVAQNARMVAAQGQPEYVRNLLNQGYDLAQIYAPYKQTMASILELDPEQIDLNDPTLRSAINNNGDMNIYDFKKALRRDNRWQYTEAARQDVSNAALSVLRDFGFQG
jgi:hypothetical protein